MLFSQTVGLHGQLSDWVTVNPKKEAEAQIGLRYIPELSLGKRISDNFSLDAEISFNSYGTVLFQQDQEFDTDGKVKPYRMWLRLSSSQFELRFGLQKLNFGSAMFLRPLMWFDRIDPRDPLQMTDGVYAFLGRYYFLNNANIWLWGLYGNDETKGWEAFPSNNKKIEYGGRVQVPVLTGEAAFTFHHREADLNATPFSSLLSSKSAIPEWRLGLDGKWDVGVGVWCEAALIHQELNLSMFDYQRLVNAGMDYTFDIGNGLNVQCEYLNMATAGSAFKTTEDLAFSAFSMSYPLGIIDNFSTIIYYNWDNSDWYRFINWQRTFDRWSLYFMAFWNPDQFQIYQIQGDNNLFAGRGLQVLVSFHH
ncbi:MAG: hypothetical protein ACOY90_14640 [Candidatus Zhuqueibacterota bacterium]